MSFPTIVSAAGGTKSGNPIAGGNVTITLPTTQAGDTLLVFLADRYGALGGHLATPSGWTLRNSSYAIWTKAPCDGTEGGTSPTFASGLGEAYCAWMVVLVRGADTASSSYAQAGASGTPANLTPAWGAKDTLWLVAAADTHGGCDAGTTITYPTAFTLSRTKAATGGFEDIGWAVCGSQQNIATVVPGAMTNDNHGGGMDTIYTVGLAPRIVPRSSVAVLVG